MVRNTGLDWIRLNILQFTAVYLPRGTRRAKIICNFLLNIKYPHFRRLRPLKLKPVENADI